jgi:hypothetical protein
MHTAARAVGRAFFLRLNKLSGATIQNGYFENKRGANVMKSDVVVQVLKGLRAIQAS